MRHGDFAQNLENVAGPPWSGRRVALVSIVGSWALHLVFIAVKLVLHRFPHVLLLMPWQCLCALSGAILTSLLRLMIDRVDGRPFVTRIASGLALAVPIAGLLGTLNYVILFILAPARIWSAVFLNTITLRGVVGGTIAEYYFVLIAWVMFYISVLSALESQEAQRRAAVFQAEGRKAELRALRYQLNPHFLFNALNTVSALVLRGDAEGAESTIQALSLFLRSTLTSETVEDATLAEELDLQRLYLEIEQVRYGDRLRVLLSVPESLQSALLPPLLLQPLVENVIRHAVAPSREPVTMTIGARADVDCLHVLVEDDGRGGNRSDDSRTGIGLRNAAARLATRFGGAARCKHGPRPGGGYRVELVLPLRLRAPPA